MEGLSEGLLASTDHGRPLLKPDRDEDALQEPGRAGAPPRGGRLASLDVVRGMSVALMIFVDDVGEAYPRIDHSPWNGITLADYVMPVRSQPRRRLMDAGAARGGDAG